jgi:GntP family gluconate:H+ symporter
MSFALTLTLVIISIIAIIILTSKLKLNSFISLFVVSIFLAFATIPADTIIATIKEGFGSTMGSIGFLVILGAMIGVILDKTGGMVSIANYILSKTGQHNAPAALGITGFVTGVPIFCDSGYVILSGLVRSFSAKTRIAMPFMATVLATSLYSVHCLIPPHPGALAGAGILNTNVGNLILAGIIFAIPGALTAYFWSRWMVKGKNYPPAEDIIDENQLSAEKIPPVFLSLLPVVVPLLLIILRSLISLIDQGIHNGILKILYIAGDPVYALFIGVLLALLLIKNVKMDKVNSMFSEAIEKAGPILVVTAAGGMFGMVIKTTGVGEEAGKMLAGTSLGLVVPFLISAFLKTAQGSSTVAIITTASFMAPMMTMLGLDSEWGRLLAMLSIGAGSMVFSHANDSYFWVVSKFSNLSVDVTLKVYSSSTFVMGIVIFTCIWISSIFIL